MDSYRQTPSPDRGKAFFVALAGLLSALVVSGCAVGQQPSPTPSASASRSASPAYSVAPEFPRRLTDDEGTAVELATQPQRVISLSPAFTEIVFALGAGDRLVGGTDYDDFPPEAVALPDVATYTGVVIERVVDLHPDLVLAGGNNLTARSDVTRLRDLGVPVLVTYPPTVSAVLDDIRLIGAALGVDAEAATLTAAMRARLDEVTGAVAALGRPKVFYEIGYQPEIYGPAPNSFVADMVGLAGGDPITTTDPAVFSISLEQLVAADPDVIVMGDAAYRICPVSLVARPGWENVTAVRNAALRPVDDIVVTRPGPRLGDGLALLALAIHPDAQITPPAHSPVLCTSPSPSP